MSAREPDWDRLTEIALYCNYSVLFSVLSRSQAGSPFCVGDLRYESMLSIIWR